MWWSCWTVIKTHSECSPVVLCVNFIMAISCSEGAVVPEVKLCFMCDSKSSGAEPSFAYKQCSVD